MNPMSAATLAVVAALLSIAAAASAHLMMRKRMGSGASSRDLGELERAVEDLVRRLEATAGRCIHDLESRGQRLQLLLTGEETAGPDATSRPETERTPDAKPVFYFGSEMALRAAQACELADRETDEAAICRITGLQRAELRMLLSLRRARPNVAEPPVVPLH